MQYLVFQDLLSDNTPINCTSLEQAIAKYRDVSNDGFNVNSGIAVDLNGKRIDFYKNHVIDRSSLIEGLEDQYEPSVIEELLKSFPLSEII